MDESFAERKGDKVDSLCRARGKNHFPSVRCVDEPFHSVPGALIFFGSICSKLMYGAVDVGIRTMHKGIPFGNDRLWTLRRRRIVKIDQRPAVNGLRQGRKHGPYFLYIHLKLPFLGVQI